MVKIENKADLLTREVFKDIFANGTAKAGDRYEEYYVEALKLRCSGAFHEMYQNKRNQLRRQELGMMAVNTYKHNKKEYVLPENYNIVNNRIVELDKRNIEYFKVYDGVLIIDKVYSNIDNEDMFYNIINIVDGVEKNITVRANLINDIREIVKLSNRGLLVSVNYVKNVSHFLTEMINLNRKIIIKKVCTNRFGWLDESFDNFLPYGDVHFVGADDFMGQYKAIKTKGDYDVWKKEINRISRNNTQMRLYIAAVFASPLVEILQKQGFILHMWGKSEIGKTVAMYAAMSAWGDPVDLSVNFNTTAVGMERYAGLFNNMPLAVDEGELGNDRVLSFESFTYLMTQGQGKTRGNKEGGIQIQSKWNLISITNAEKSILEGNSKEGMSNRIVEIHCRKPISDDLIRTVNIMRNNYGHAGKIFIKKLINRELSIASIKELYTMYYNHCYKEGEKASKQSIAYAILLLGDTLKSMFIDGLEVVEATESSLKLYDYYKPYIKSSLDIDPTMGIYQDILDWASENSNSFVSSYWTKDEYGHESVKQTITPNNKIFGRYDDDENVLYVICKTLKDFLTKEGYPIKKTIFNLKESGLMIKYKNRGEKPVNINNNTTRCYQFKLR